MINRAGDAETMSAPPTAPFAPNAPNAPPSPPPPPPPAPEDEGAAIVDDRDLPAPPATRNATLESSASSTPSGETAKVVLATVLPVLAAVGGTIALALYLKRGMRARVLRGWVGSMRSEPRYLPPKTTESPSHGPEDGGSYEPPQVPSGSQGGSPSRYSRTGGPSPTGSEDMATAATATSMLPRSGTATPPNGTRFIPSYARPKPAAESYTITKPTDRGFFSSLRKGALGPQAAAMRDIFKRPDDDHV